MLTTDTRFRGRLIPSREARKLIATLTGVEPQPGTFAHWCTVGFYGKVLPSKLVGNRRFLFEGDVQDYVRILTRQDPFTALGVTDEGASV